MDTDARREAAKALSLVPFHRPWSIGRCIEVISIERERPILVMDLPLNLANFCSALWISDQSIDRIYVDVELKLLHREIAIAHELGHILLRHSLPSMDHAGFVRRTFPEVPADLAEDVFVRSCGLPRSNYADEYEQQAEWFARLLITKAEKYRMNIVSDSVQLPRLRLLEEFAGAFGWP